MPKLLTIAHSYVVAMNRRLVREMARAGGEEWEVVAVAPDYFHGSGDLRPVSFERSADELNRIEVVPAHLTSRVHLFHYARKLRAILREGWDIVHAWEEPYVRVGWQIARWTPRQSSLIYRSAQSISKNYPPPFNWFEKYAMKRAAGWICSGTLVEECLKSRSMYRDKPMARIPLGVDVDVFKPDPAARAKVLQHLNWREDGAPVVGYLGRFVPAKGLSILMSALDGVKPDWRAMFVGAGPMEKDLRAFAARHGDSVRICTDVRHDAASDYLAAMDVMAAPSQTAKNWREQFGRMLIEAFAAGVAVIGSDSGEIPHVIGESGIVCPERDIAAWTTAIESLLNDRTRRSEIAQRGLDRAHREFDWPVVGKMHLDFFERILSR